MVVDRASAVPVVGKLGSTPIARLNLSIMRRLRSMASSRFIAANNATFIITHATPTASRAWIMSFPSTSVFETCHEPGPARPSNDDARENESEKSIFAP
jgi:hypothetical protein